MSEADNKKGSAELTRQDASSTPEGNSADESEAQPSPEVSSALNKLSDERPEAVSQFLAMMGTAPGANPLHKKMTASHIDQVLGLAADHDQREFALHQESQSQSRLTLKLYFASFLVFALLVVLILILFQDQPNVLIPALTGIGGLGSGLLGGYGLGRRSR